mmetsp:Transcript_26341/g.35082  ORF Transcript_26341/g.35082 Transcript_26341/m.35082 type:complete len:124 (-) Transcript_26341:8-379(-)
MSVGKFVSAMYFVSIGLSWMISSSGDALDCFVDAAVRSLLFLRTESVVVVARDAAVEEEEGGVTAFEPPRKTWGKRLKVDLKCHLRSRGEELCEEVASASPVRFRLVPLMVSSREEKGNGEEG